jgi:hypothetical protein
VAHRLPTAPTLPLNAQDIGTFRWQLTNKPYNDFHW